MKNHTAQNVFDKIREDMDFLENCLLEVLSDLGEQELVELLKNDKESEYSEHPELEEKQIQVLSIYLQLMKAYAALVKDQQIGHELLNIITSAHQESLEQISDLFERDQMERRKSLLDNLNRRNTALNALHKIQIKNLKHWRATKESNEKAYQRLVTHLLEITTALASGLKNTG